MNYNYPLFRPPSEANSLIIQLTHGCSWNQCIFCEMYTTKKFTVKSHEVFLNEIEKIKQSEIPFNKVFLADGDAMVLSTQRLLKILEQLKTTFPNLRRISAYARPKDIQSKSLNELKELHQAGLNLLYTGLESGDDKVLQLMNKGETYQSMAQAMIQCKQSGIKSSVMIINGLGGREFTMNHAINSARLVNEIQPDYLSTLVLSFPFGIEHFQNRLNHNFEMLNPDQLLDELGMFIANTQLDSSIFRSDHASNYLVLKGILGKDKDSIIKKISEALNNSDKSILRKEWQRGL